MVYLGYRPAMTQADRLYAQHLINWLGSKNRMYSFNIFAPPEARFPLQRRESD
ncbi:hypothetical protein QWZ13_11450 [Reinekea marina]|uniref:hypothetical protein n=1 Tax=Reinekea marina TaxID=1310421 RepID=UPI0025B3F505|nr:hypothetical protein [Reinekea marina]MDN3649530.1 hypothetical protein [Reinekea marina]